MKKSLQASVCILGLMGCASNGWHQSWRGNVSPIDRVLIAESKRQAVTVAIIGGVDTSYSKAALARGGVDIEQWKFGTLRSIQTHLEQSLLESMSSYPNFHIVDRAAVDQVFEELKLSLSGGMAPDIRLKIGQLTKANHLIIFQAMRYAKGDARGVSEVTLRLISVETGEVLASQAWKS